MKSSGKRTRQPDDKPRDRPVAKRRAWVRLLLFALGAGLAGVAAVALHSRFAGSGDASAVDRVAPAAFVGAAACAGCHAAQNAAWRFSHHALAMQVADERTVLGDFNDATFVHDGVTTRFFRRDGKFFVNTDGRDDKLADFEIGYTFGVFPLQQYLIAFPDGRLQALSIAWDARPKEKGGQRWFHLYPDESIRAGDVLHWTGLNQNWNFMCAECHSTGLRKNYDASGNRYHTSWSDIDVSCEACHGPGSAHVAWAERRREWWRFGTGDEKNKGLAVAFDERKDVSWVPDPAGGTAQRNAPPKPRVELETCGRCHARRAELSEDWLPGQSLSSTHLVSLLDRGLYHADGQIDGEVYEYGSFRQSKMFAKGVTCSDCHDPHSLVRRAEGDGVCLQCHAAQKYETPKHNFHEAAAPAPGCVACHMPARTYMGVDVRRDHSFRVPRPDLSASLGTPNACNDCHRDKSAEWAAASIERWFGKERVGWQRFAPALAAARQSSPQARDLLMSVAIDPQTPGIALATAYAEMARFAWSADVAASLRRGVADGDPLVRLGALRGLDGASIDQRWALAAPLLSDPVRAVRIEAAALLAAMPAARMSADERQRFERAAQDYTDVQRFNADRPEAHSSLGAFLARRGLTAAAETEYRAAIALEKQFIQAYVNLADLYRMLGRDRDGETLLRQALTVAPDDAATNHSLGLLLIRAHRPDEALPLFAKAVALDPNQTRYAYVYGIALNAAGRQEDALRVLDEAHTRDPADRDTLTALMSLNRVGGNDAAAARYANELAKLTPAGSNPQ